MAGRHRGGGPVSHFLLTTLLAALTLAGYLAAMRWLWNIFIGDDTKWGE